MIKIIEKELKKHRKHLDRYLLEVQESGKGRRTRKKQQQLLYSYSHAERELSVCDALEDVLKLIKKKQR